MNTETIEIEVDYWNEDAQIRTKRIQIPAPIDERLLPFKIRELDRSFSKIRRWKEVKKA